MPRTGLIHVTINNGNPSHVAAKDYPYSFIPGSFMPMLYRSTPPPPPPPPPPNATDKGGGGWRGVTKHTQARKNVAESLTAMAATALDRRVEFLGWA